MRPLLTRLSGRLVVSVQAREGSPLRHVDTIVRLARAAVEGGAAAIRVNGPDDVAAVREAVRVPVIGLWKDESLRSPTSVFITPTVERAVALVEAGADVVAADGTDRPRTDSFADLVAAVHQRGALVMADVASAADGVFAERSGADCVGTTLAGYTAETAGEVDGPSFGLIAELAAAVRVPVLAEGRLSTPDDVATAFARGAHAAVVGTAITNPTWITGQLAAATPTHPTAPAPR